MINALKLQKELGQISKQAGAGPSFLRTEYETGDGPLPFYRLKWLIEEELSREYDPQEFYLMLKMGNFGSLARVISQAMKLPVVTLNTNYTVWKSLLGQDSFPGIKWLLATLDNLAETYKFVLLFDDFTIFNKFGGMHYNAKTKKLGGISDYAIEAVQACVAYQHSLVLCIPDMVADGFYSAMGNRQFKPLTHKLTNKFQQQVLPELDPEGMVAINGWLSKGNIPAGYAPNDIYLGQLAVQARPLIDRIKLAYNSVEKGGRCLTVIEPSLSGLSYVPIDTLTLAKETLGDKTVQVIDCYQLVKETSTPGKQPKRIIGGKFRGGHDKFYVVKNWSSLAGHSNLKDTLSKTVRDDLRCRTVFALNENEYEDAKEILNSVTKNVFDIQNEK